LMININTDPSLRGYLLHSKTQYRVFINGRLRRIISIVILKMVKTERRLRGLVIMSYSFAIR